MSIKKLINYGTQHNVSTYSVFLRCATKEMVTNILYICRLMRRRIKVADPRIFLIYAAYVHIREEVVDEYHYEHTAVRNVPGIRVVLDYEAPFVSKREGFVNTPGDI